MSSNGDGGIDELLRAYETALDGVVEAEDVIERLQGVREQDTDAWREAWRAANTTQEILVRRAEKARDAYQAALREQRN